VIVRGGWFKRLDERGLKLLLGAFFLALAIPAAVLVAQAYGQLKWEAFRGTQLVAEELAARIDAQLRAAVAAEDARSFGDWSFLVVEGDAAANFVQRSPLSAFPVTSAVPGVLGYFQVDAAGRLTTPLLPDENVTAASYGIGPEEEAARAARVAELRDVLAQNRLVRGVREDLGPGSADLLRFEAPRATADGPTAAERRSRSAESAQAPAEPAAPEAQAGFDRVASAGSGVASVRSAVRAEAADARQKRVEQTLVPVAEAEGDAAGEVASDADVRQVELRVRTFESEVDPFAVGALDTGELVLFRNAWRDGQRYVQGALVDRAAFLATAVGLPYRASSVAGIAGVSVSFQGRRLDTLSSSAAPYSSAAGDLVGTLLHRARLSPPFGDLELEFAVDSLLRAPGAALLAWVAVTLALVLCGGFVLMYRFAVGQMRLARQQQDFVSAVSHELKTPLTSIRMYGEMLRAGWADEAKKQTYYDFIHSESERLSRLIENVLQLARLTRSTQHFDLKPASVAELMDMVRSKVATQVERAGFELRLRNDAQAGTTVVVDADAFAQIVINLVDNALKFAAGAQVKAVEVAARRESGGGVLITVRDFGPGVPKAQMRKIFELFYRPENALTRETGGTGIGLALVRQLAVAMNGRVDLRNCEPGAEFRLHLPIGGHE
jgi:signal transduction histidine kinase